MKCLNCGKELESIKGKEKRRFCSDKCRKAFSRQKQGIIENPQNQVKIDIVESARTNELRTIRPEHRTESTPDSNIGQDYILTTLGPISKKTIAFYRWPTGAHWKRWDGHKWMSPEQKQAQA